MLLVTRKMTIFHCHIGSKDAEFAAPAFYLHHSFAAVLQGWLLQATLCNFAVSAESSSASWDHMSAGPLEEALSM